MPSVASLPRAPAGAGFECRSLADARSGTRCAAIRSRRRAAGGDGPRGARIRGTGATGSRGSTPGRVFERRRSVRTDNMTCRHRRCTRARLTARNGGIGSAASRQTSSVSLNRSRLPGAPAGIGSFGVAPAPGPDRVPSDLGPPRTPGPPVVRTAEEEFVLLESPNSATAGSARPARRSSGPTRTRFSAMVAGNRNGKGVRSSASACRRRPSRSRPRQIRPAPAAIRVPGSLAPPAGRAAFRPTPFPPTRSEPAVSRGSGGGVRPRRRRIAGGARETGVAGQARPGGRKQRGTPRTR